MFCRIAIPELTTAALCSVGLPSTPEFPAYRMDNLSKPTDTVPCSGAGRGVQPVSILERKVSMHAQSICQAATDDALQRAKVAHSMLHVSLDYMMHMAF